MKLTSLILLSLLAFNTPCKADSILFSSGAGTSSTDASFEGSLSYNGSTITLGLTNTSIGPASPLRIVGMGFVSPLQGLTFSNFTTDNANFQGIYDFPMPPFPDGDFGAATSPTWLGMGAGHVSRGYLSGNSATFSWDVSGSDAQTLTAMDFGQMYVRFKGGHMSDKVPGIPTNPVPEPSSVLLALGAAAAFGRRFLSR